MTEHRVECAIYDCVRSRAGEVGQAWICSEHWRKHCPPRSARRRAYHRFFRQAKQHGWGHKGGAHGARLDWRYWQFWDTLVRLANAENARGKIDMTEINSLFGWTDDA